MQIGIDHTFFVVVVDLTVVEQRMTHSEIENAGIALLIAALGLRQIVSAVRIHKNADNGMIHGYVIQIPRLAH